MKKQLSLSVLSLLVCCSIQAQSRQNINPMLTTAWGQGDPYNRECPTTYFDWDLEQNMSGQTITGCIATATAQVLNFWQMPQGTFDWTSMSNTYNGSNTDAQCSAVAKLMHTVGVGLGMEYGPVISSTYLSNAVGLLKGYGYSGEVCYRQRKNFSKSEWENLLYAELENGHPVLYGGGEIGSGHCFVIDGYRDGKFHFNFGWEGVSDGYYDLDVVYPPVQGAGIADLGRYGFGSNQEAVFGVHPATQNDVTPFMVESQVDGQYYLENPDYQVVMSNTGGKLNVKGTFTPSSNTEKYDMGVELCKDGKSVYLTAVEEVMGTLKEFDVALTGVANGKYHVYPVYRRHPAGEEATWFRAHYQRGYFCYDHADVTVDNGAFTVEKPVKAEYGKDVTCEVVSVPEEVVKNKIFTVRLRTTNNGSETYYSNLAVSFWGYISGQYTCKSAYIALELAAGESREYEVEFLAPGSTPDRKMTIDVYDFILDKTYEKKEGFINIIDAPASVSLTVAQNGLATMYYEDCDLTVPEGVDVFTYVLDGNSVKAQKIEGVIPAGTGVVVEAAQGVYQFATGNATAGKVRNLVCFGNDSEASNHTSALHSAQKGKTYKYYGLMKGTGTGDGYNWYWGAADGEAFSLPAHKAFIVIDSEMAQGARMIPLQDEAAGINNIPGYTVRDVKFIENGRIVIVKNGCRFNIAGQQVK